MDAVLILSGYCIATWSYTQGAYLASLVGFRQLLIGAFAGALFMLLLYQLPVILSVRYGIDIWIWLRAVFGVRGVKAMTLVIIAVNFPWYAVCADLFASSMENLARIFGLPLPSGSHLMLALLCVLLGSGIAFKGLGPITWSHPDSGAGSAGCGGAGDGNRICPGTVSCDLGLCSAFGAAGPAHFLCPVH